MGFFGSAFNSIGKFFTAPQRAVSKVLEKIGDAIYLNCSSRIMEGLGNGISAIGKFINPPFYDDDTATTEVVFDSAAFCKEYYDKVADETKRDLDKAINGTDNTINSVKYDIQPLISEEMYEIMNNNIPSDPFSEIKEKALNNIAEKISLSNDEFKALLNIRSESERKEKCNEYVTKFSKENLSNTIDEILGKRNEIIDGMRFTIKEEFKNLDRDIEASRNYLNQLATNQDNPEYMSHKVFDNTVDLAFLSSILTVTSAQNTYL